jgi:hypothetical protein
MLSASSFRKVLHWAAVPALLAGYSLLHVATSKKCDDECRKLNDLEQALSENRTYFRYADFPNDSTLQIHVTDTTGINWNHFADTACLLAQSKGAARHYILVTNMTFPPDTLERMECW